MDLASAKHRPQTVLDCALPPLAKVGRLKRWTEESNPRGLAPPLLPRESPRTAPGDQPRFSHQASTRRQASGAKAPMTRLRSSSHLEASRRQHPTTQQGQSKEDTSPAARVARPGWRTAVVPTKGCQTLATGWDKDRGCPTRLRTFRAEPWEAHQLTALPRRSFLPRLRSASGGRLLGGRT